MAGRSLGDSCGVLAVAQRRSGLLDGGKPGLVDELEQPARRRRHGAGLRIETRLDLGRRQQVLKTRPGGLRCLANSAGHRRAGGLIAGIDQHGFCSPAGSHRLHER